MSSMRQAWVTGIWKDRSRVRQGGAVAQPRAFSLMNWGRSDLPCPLGELRPWHPLQESPCPAAWDPRLCPWASEGAPASWGKATRGERTPSPYAPRVWKGKGWAQGEAGLRGSGAPDGRHSPGRVGHCGWAGGTTVRKGLRALLPVCPRSSGRKGEAGEVPRPEEARLVDSGGRKLRTRTSVFGSQRRDFATQAPAQGPGLRASFSERCSVGGPAWKFWADGAVRAWSLAQPLSPA